MHPHPAIGKRISEILEDPARTDEEFTGEGGKAYRVRKQPAPGVRALVEYRNPDQPFERMTEIFEATAERPPSYPDDLPFVAGTDAIVGGMIATIPPSRMVAWGDVADVQQFADRVIEQSEADGWEPVGSSVPNPFGPMLQLRRDSATRYVCATASNVFVLQTEPA
jgi:hypothetical protein